MTRPGVRRQPSGPRSVAAGVGAVAVLAALVSLLGLGLAFVADLLLT